MIKNISTSLLLLILSACGASITPQECQTLNWYEKGIADGEAGEDFRIIDDYKSDCAKVSIIPDEKMYYAGYHKGLLTFCTYDNGFQAGRRGGQAIGCPDGTEYFAGWKAGIKEYSEERERREIEQLTRPRNNEVSPPGGGQGATGP